MSPLEVPDRFAELTVAEDVLDRAPKVPTVEMALHDILGQLRKGGEKVPNSSRSSPRGRPACVNTKSCSTHRHVDVLSSMTYVGRQAWGDPESLQRIA